MSSQADEWPLTTTRPQAYGEPWSATSYRAPSGMNWMAIGAWNDEQHLFSLDDRELADHIVACVNACAGIANPAALGALIEACNAVLARRPVYPASALGALRLALADLDANQEETP